MNSARSSTNKTRDEMHIRSARFSNRVVLFYVVLATQSLPMRARAQASARSIALLPQGAVVADLQHRGSLSVGLLAAYDEPATPWTLGLRLSGQAGLAAASLVMGPVVLRGSAPGGPPVYRIDLSGRLTRTWLLSSSKPDILLGADLGLDVFLFPWVYLRVLIGASHKTATTAEDPLTPNIGIGLSFL
jgi:hypothetical protein